MKSNTMVDWKKYPSVVVNSLKKKKLTQFLFALLVGVSLCTVLYLWMDTALLKLGSRLSNELIKPEMTQKANEGKVKALLWMAEHYPDEHTEDELDTLIEQDNPDAMLFKAQRVYSVDKSLAFSLIQQAAQAGYPDAITYLSDKKATLGSLVTFLTQYEFKDD